MKKSVLKNSSSLRLLAGLLLALSLGACTGGDETSSSSSNDTSSSNSTNLSGNIIVSTTTTDAVIMFDSNGDFVDLIYSPPSGSAQVVGLAWDAVNEEVIITLDGPDHIVAVNPITKDKRVLYLHAQLNGTIRSAVQLPTAQDFLVVETNCLERFDSEGNRTVGTWPLCTGLNTPQQISPISGGGFLMCSTGTDDIRVYDEDGNLSASASIGNDPYGCTELSDGRIASAQRGNDEIRIYSSDLTTLEMTFDNTSVITDPRGIAEDSEGNILVTDVSYDHVAVIDTSGNYLRDFGGWILNDPYDIIVIP